MVILCGEFHLSHGETLKCEFANDDYYLVGHLYQCKVTALDNSFNNMTIDGYTGVHKASKNYKDVKAIWINGGNTKYIPHGLGSMFNLLGLAIWTSQLIEIKSNDYQGMHNLEYLSLSDNKLTSVPSDVFSTLTKLKVISFRNNQIKYFGSGGFDQLMNLYRVDLSSNICVNKKYEGASAIIHMKRDIKVNCVEQITTTTTTTTTQNPMEIELEAAKQHQKKNEIELNNLRDDLKKEQLENTKVNKEKDALMGEKNALATEKGAWIKESDELKLELINKTIEFNELNKKFETNCKQPIETIGTVDVKLSEIMNHLLKESKDHQKECNEIIKLRAELSTSKDLLKAAQDQQKKESSEAKETMKQTINDLNTEVMELKSLRQLERNTYMGLRTKLMKTKEQLATCEINERSSV
ncbi:unnamed protein product [Diamesa hyperborea]